MESVTMLVNGGVKQMKTDYTFRQSLCGTNITGELLQVMIVEWNVMTSGTECLLVISGKFMFVRTLVYCWCVVIPLYAILQA